MSPQFLRRAPRLSLLFFVVALSAGAGCGGDSGGEGTLGNQPPTVTVEGARTVRPGSTLVLTVTAIDPEGAGTSLSAAPQPLPANAAFVDATGVFVFTPDTSQRGSTVDVTFSASDGETSSSEKVSIRVEDLAPLANSAPVLAPIGSKTVRVGSQLILDNDAGDADGDTVSFAIEPPPPAHASYDSATGRFTFTPTEDQIGVQAFTFLAGDGKASDYETIAIEVLPRATACTPDAPPAGCTALGTGSGGDLAVRDQCYTVGPGSYNYHYVNVAQGGQLIFLDNAGTIDFQVGSLLVEQGGSVTAGSVSCPFGSGGGKLMIGLWGDDPTDQGTNQSPTEQGIACIGPTSADAGQCYPPAIADGQHYCLEPDPVGTWTLTDPCETEITDPTMQAANGNALFEDYGHHGLNFDAGSAFGYKVLAVSYGGSLQLFGRKGVAADDLVDPSTRQTTCDTPANQYDVDQWAALSGSSWARLGQTAANAQTTVALDRPVDWNTGDYVVVGTTDWQPSHSELAQVASATTPTGGATSLTLSSNLQYPHYGQTYSVPSEITKSTENPNTEVDLRGSVGLLTRDITIESLGATQGSAFPAAPAAGQQPSSDWLACGYASDGQGGSTSSPSCYFGGHVIARQGFANFQVQGVEFRQLGQGGRMGHYPVHFHLAKDTSYTNAFVKDSSIWDSMTRFITLHGTLGVTLARNVGFLSMGHGYYLEDGAEIDNLLCHNLAVSIRGSLAEYFSAQSSSSPTYRFIPPVLDRAADISNTQCSTSGMVMPFCSAPCQTPSGGKCIEIFTTQFNFGGDTLFPVAFWAMNAQNEFVGNKAVGVHGYGSCYWLLGSNLSGPSAMHTWTSGTGTPADYAGYNLAGQRQAPLLRFRGNSCNTATNALQTTFEISPGPPQSAATAGFTPILNPYVIHNTNPNCEAFAQGACDSYDRPVITGNFNPVKVGGSDPQCLQGVIAGMESDFSQNAEHCVTTLIDRFTTSFNWAEVNFGAIWLRPQWYVFLNGAVTDQLSGGLGFVSGGSWAQNPPGYFALTKDSIYLGSTQPGSTYASQLGPAITSSGCGGPICTLPADGVGLFQGGLAPKRMITIYDGPFFADGNVFAETQPFECQQSPTNPDLNGATSCGIYSSTIQPYDATTQMMQVIDASIGWKQTNDFYYPPAFALRKSGFDGMTFRHNVIDQYEEYVVGNPNNPGGQPTYYDPLSAQYPNAITPVDFSTILNDLDGTLTGWTPAGGTRTSSVSANDFFDAPSQDAECLSFGVQTSPYEFVTSVVAKLNGAAPSWYVDDNTWRSGGIDPAVPIYRQLTLPTDTCEGDLSVCCAADQTDCTAGSWGCSRATFMVGGQNGEAPYLTANNGLYYIDTNVQGTSCVTRTINDVNVDPNFHVPGFQANNTYVVYQLFANENTKVSYQLYVGTDFQAATQGYWVRVSPHSNSGDGNALLVTQETDSTVLSSLASDVSVSNGVLTVTLDSSAIASDYLLSNRPDDERCLPRDICQVDDSTNPPTRCTLQAQDAFYNLNPADYDDFKVSIGAACDYWVTAAAGRRKIPNTPGDDADNPNLADCPANGCLGYAFTLPSTFMPVSYQTGGAGLTTCFDKTTWGVTMTSVDTACPSPTPPSDSAFCQ